jgi:hypothetical protein
MLELGANQGKPFQLHNLPYQEISIIATTNKFPIIEQGYVMTNLSDAYFPKAQVCTISIRIMIGMSMGLTFME